MTPVSFSVFERLSDVRSSFRMLRKHRASDLHRQSMPKAFSARCNRFVLCVLVTSALGLVANATPVPPKLPTTYGDNRDAGRFIQLNGIKLYMETYGDGTPLLLLHPNNGSLTSLGYQIEFFRQRYQVIAVDSRGHGKSGLGPERLTYEQQADDMEALLEALGIGSAHVFGWSDGGIIGLLMALRHPARIKKLAVLGASLEPSGAQRYALDAAKAVRTVVEQKIAQHDTTDDWALRKQTLNLLLDQPKIAVQELAKILLPVLVMAGDRDLM